MRINYTRAIIAGAVATVVMTAVGVFGAPMMGMPKMNPAEMLAAKMGGNLLFGWMGHFMVGVALAVIYAAVAPRLAGPAWLRGALFGLAPWLLQQFAVMPMMGMGLFSGSMALAGGSMLGHLVYGAVVGAIYGLQAERLTIPIAPAAPQARGRN